MRMGGGWPKGRNAKKEPRNGEFLSPFAGRYWGVDMFKIGETRTYQLGGIRSTHSLTCSVETVKNFFEANPCVNAGLLEIF